MTLKTRKIRVNLVGPDGLPSVFAAISAELSVRETDGLLIVPTLVRGQTDINGTGLINLWPNSRGTAGSQYKITAIKSGGLLLSVMATVPDGDAATEVALESIITAIAPATVSDAQLAVLQAQAQVDLATTQRTLADADVVLTHADVVSTHADAAATAADAVQTGANVLATAADVLAAQADAGAAHADMLLAQADAVQTALDRIATAADLAQTTLDRAATGADAAQTALDVTATAADRAQTSIDVIATAADLVATAADAAQTALDRVQTGADVLATAADVLAAQADATAAHADMLLAQADAVQTALDRIATAADAVTTTAKAGEATASAAAAAASFDSFDDRYLGAKAAAPTLDNDGAALLTGALYWDTTLTTLRVWTGAAWTNTTELDARVLADQQLLGQDTYVIDIAGQLAKELVGLPAGVEALANFAAEVMDLVGVAARQSSTGAQIVPAPANASARGSTGEWAWDSGFIYICTALNTWKRVAIATW